MLLRSFSTEKGGGLVEITDQAGGKRPLLLFANDYVHRIAEIDERTAVAVSHKGELALFDVEDVRVLSRAKFPPNYPHLLPLRTSSQLLVVGEHYSRLWLYQIPQLQCVAKYEGLAATADGGWQLAEEGSVEAKRRHGGHDGPDFRALLVPFGLIAERADGLVVAVPRRGQPVDRYHVPTDSRPQSEVLKICLITGRVTCQGIDGQAVGNSANAERLMPIESLSPDGRYAIRRHLEPIVYRHGQASNWAVRDAEERPSLLQRLKGFAMPGSQLGRGRTPASRGAPPAPEQPPAGGATARPRVLGTGPLAPRRGAAYIGFPVELWDLDGRPELAGLLVPEWREQKDCESDYNRINDKEMIEVWHRAAPFLPAALESLEWPEDSIISAIDDAPSHSLRSAIKWFGFVTKNRFAIFPFAQMMNRLERSFMERHDWPSLPKEKREVYLAIVSALRTFVELRITPVGWQSCPGDPSAIWLGHHGGRLRRLSVDGRRSAEVLFDALGYDNRFNLVTPCGPDALRIVHGHDHLEPRWHGGSSMSTIDIGSLDDLSENDSLKIGARTSVLHWASSPAAYAADNKHASLVAKGRFGVVTLKSQSETHWIEALSKLASLIVKENRSRLVIGDRYEPTLSLKGDLLNESAFCDRLVEDETTGAVPVLESLLAALDAISEGPMLAVYHFNDGTPTGVPCAFATIKISGQVSEPALRWIARRDAGHESYCLKAIEDVVERLGYDAPGVAELAVVLFVQENLMGHFEDERKLPHFKGLLAHHSKEKVRKLLRELTPMVCSTHRQYPSFGEDSESLGDEERIEMFVDWALQQPS